LALESGIDLEAELILVEMAFADMSLPQANKALNLLHIGLHDLFEVLGLERFPPLNPGSKDRGFIRMKNGNERVGVRDDLAPVIFKRMTSPSGVIQGKG